jgi:tetrahydrodipicolinate N-succinyltransferase
VGVAVGVAVSVGAAVGLGAGVRVGTGVAVAAGEGGTVAVKVAVGTGVPVGGGAVGVAPHDASTSHATSSRPRATTGGRRRDRIRDRVDTFPSSFDKKTRS